MARIIVSDRKRIWKPAVTKLIKNFHEAMISLIPTFDKSKITWKDSAGQSEGYDGIAEALYQWFVIDNIETFMKEKFNRIPNIAKYNFYYKGYTKLSFIQVTTEREDMLGYQALTSLGSSENAFDTVYCDKIDKSGAVVKKNIKYKWDDVKFVYQHRKVDGSLEPYEKIQITL